MDDGHQFKKEPFNLRPENELEEDSSELSGEGEKEETSSKPLPLGTTGKILIAIAAIFH